MKTEPKKPTRDDAIARLRARWNSPLRDTFERTARGAQCAKGMYGGPNGDMCRQYQREFEQKQQATIDDTLLTLEREYDRAMTEYQTAQQRDAEALAAITEELRRAYMEFPGSTEAGFAAALPDLLEQRRRQAAMSGNSEVNQAMDKMRGAVARVFDL